MARAFVEVMREHWVGILVMCLAIPLAIWENKEEDIALKVFKEETVEIDGHSFVLVHKGCLKCQ